MYVQARSLIIFITQLTRKFSDNKNKGKDQRPYNIVIICQINIYFQSTNFVFKYHEEYTGDINNFIHYLCLSVRVNACSLTLAWKLIM